MALASFVRYIMDNDKTILDLDDQDIKDDGATALATALLVNTSLTSLNLDGNGIGDSGATALATALHVNTTLTILNVCNNHIGDDGATALSTALDGNTTLRSLNIQYNNVGDEGIMREIDRKLQRNVILYIDMLWEPFRHGDFPPVVHDLIVTTLLCNDAVGEKKLPRLPLIAWQQVFSFYCQKDFL